MTLETDGLEHRYYLRTCTVHETEDGWIRTNITGREQQRMKGDRWNLSRFEKINMKDRL